MASDGYGESGSSQQGPQPGRRGISRLAKVLGTVVIGGYALLAGVMLAGTAWPALREHGVGVADSVMVVFAAIVSAVLGGMFTDALPRLIWSWLLLALAGVLLGVLNYEVFSRHSAVHGVDWVGLVIVAGLELAGFCSLVPVLFRLYMGQTPAEVFGRNRK